MPPAADGTWVEQSQTVKNLFVWGYQGVFAVGMIILFALFWFFKVEKEMPSIREEMIARQKAKAAAQGIEWVSPEEIAAREQEENDRIAEENRVKELREKCAKKGLSFEEEEARYQAKLAAKTAKEDAKKAKKAK